MSFPYALFSWNYCLSLAVLKICPYKLGFTIEDASFLKVSFYCFGHSEFPILTYSIHEIIVFEGGVVKVP
jgi:hypothetical protein